MDAKMRANFINSVAGGKKVTCPSCNTLNDADSKFCMTCGTKLESFGSMNDNGVANDGIKNDQNEKSEKRPAFKVAEPAIEESEEPQSAFAQGLPSWDVLPPQIMVRRKGKR